MSSCTDATDITADPRSLARRAATARTRCACVAELRAVCAILFGVSALCLSFLTFSWLMSLFILFLVADAALGILPGVFAAWPRERGVAALLPAMANMLAATALLLVPAMSLTALVTLLGIWAAVTGLLGMDTAWRGAAGQGRFILLAVGSWSVGWACLLCLTHGMLPVALAWWLGFYAVVLGVMLLLLAPRLRAEIRLAA